jgi:hypothetical protein
MYRVNVFAARKFEVLVVPQFQATKNRDVHLKDKSGDRRTSFRARVRDECRLGLFHIIGNEQLH